MPTTEAAMSVTTAGQVAVQMFGCPSCHVPLEARCVTGTAKPTVPHIQRWRLGEGFLARQAEVDDLAGRLKSAQDSVAVAGVVARADAARIVELGEQLQAARAEIDRLNPPPTPAPEPAPAPPDTLFGFWAGSDPAAPGNARQNYDRVSGYLGAPDVYRMFNPGLPQSPFKGSNADYGPPVVVSFKAPPVEVAAGKHDAHFAAWFGSIPADRDVWWSYFHEPENDVEAGAFTAAQYRAAWAHLIALAPKRATLHPTLILMRYTLSIPARRKVADYVTPGLEVLCWDSYLTGNLTIKDVVDTPAAVSASFGLDFAIGETSAKDPAKIEPFARALIPAARAAGAKFVTWFETDKSGQGINEADWRMRPQPGAVATWTATGLTAR